MSNWEVTTKESKLTLTSEQVVRMLSEKVVGTQRADIDELCAATLEYLNNTSILSTFKLMELVHLGWMMGYYYKTFLDKNQVVVRSTNEQDHSSTS